MVSDRPSSKALEHSEQSSERPAQVSGPDTRACPACDIEYPSVARFCPRDGTELLPVGEDPLIGSWLTDTYRIESVIDRGGTSVVYKARHELMDRVVAVKMLQPQLIYDQSNVVMRFQQEAKAASCLNHPHISTIYDFGVTSKGRPYLIMDYLDGMSLADLIAKQGGIPYQRAVKIFSQVCDAMEHAHQRGVIHRDLKPSNILFMRRQGGEDFVKVADFGIAKLMPWADKQDADLTQPGQVFGSPVCMSPEQCLNQAVDERSDIYGLGATMYQTLTGKPPLPGSNIHEVMQKHISEMPAPLHKTRPEVQIPERLERLVMKAMQKDPADRYQSMKELRRDLELVSKKGARQSTHTQFIKILAVDDSEFLLLALKSALEATEGLKVIAQARDGKSAVEMVPSLTPDVILMDIQMPVLNGIEATRQIKKQFPDSRIVMFTASNKEQDIFEAFSAGADGYCLKNFSNGRLIPAIHAVVDGQSWLDPEIAGRVLRLYAHTAGELLDLKPPTLRDTQTYSKQTLGAAYMLSLAKSRSLERRYPEAESLFLEAISVLEQGTGPQLDTADAVTALADMYLEHGKVDQSEPLYLRALEIRHRLLGPRHVAVAASLEKLTLLFGLHNEIEEAERFYCKSFDIHHKMPSVESSLSESSCHKLAWVYRAQKKYAEAEALDAQVREMRIMSNTLAH